MQNFGAETVKFSLPLHLAGAKTHLEKVEKRPQKKEKRAFKGCERAKDCGLFWTAPILGSATELGSADA